MSNASPDPGVHPVEQFLGPEAVEFGPFGVLGIDPTECTPGVVEAALQWQLDRVSQHPRGDTREADEVRKALHGAAAQLLDPRVREHLTAKWREAWKAGAASAPQRVPSPVAARGPVAAPVGGRPGALAPVDPFEGYRGRRDFPAGLVVGVMTAVLIVVFLGALVVFWPKGGGGIVVPGGGTAGSTPVTGVGAASSPVEESGASAATAGVEASSGVETNTDTPSAGSAPRRRRTEFAEGALIVRNLRAASGLYKSDPSKAVNEFVGAVETLSDWWCRMETGQRRASVDAVLQFVHESVGVAEHREAVLGAIARGTGILAIEADGKPQLEADGVWPAAWSAGMLMRLSREQELPAAAAGRVVDALGAALGASRIGGERSFENGGGLAARLMPARMLGIGVVRAGETKGEARGSASGPRGSTAAFQRWLELVSALAGGDEVAEERMLADALETVMVECREADADLGVFEAIGMLAARITWRKDGPARSRLMDWFKDPRVSTGDLRALTSALASRSSAEGVDPTMVLSVRSQTDDRLRLRSAYAKAWGMSEAAGADRATDSWRMAARSALGTTEGNATAGKPVDALVEAVQLARLNEAARLVWRGEVDLANSLLREGQVVLAEPVKGATNTGTQSGPNFTRHVINRTGPDGMADTTWGERYLAAERSIPIRLERLKELEDGGPPIGQVDGAILADAACFGSPVQVRIAAQRTVQKFVNEPTMVNALLDALPDAPEIVSVSEMIERATLVNLPKVSDPAWEGAARRALVERLLHMLAESSPDSGVERMSHLLSESYTRSAGQEIGSGGGAASDGAIVAAAELWESWRKEAGGTPVNDRAVYSLDQIERRRLGRLSLASGPVQTFAAWQASLAEVLAYLVSAERPARAAEVRAVIDEMQKSRRASLHVFEQMRSAERAVLRLWMLRFGEEQS